MEKREGRACRTKQKTKSVLDCRRVGDSLSVFKMLNTEIFPPECEIPLCIRKHYEDILTGSGQPVCNYNKASVEGIPC